MSDGDEEKITQLDVNVDLLRLDDEDKADLAPVMKKWGGLCWWWCRLLLGEPGAAAAKCEPVATPFFLVKYQRGGYRLWKVDDELANGTLSECMAAFVAVNKPRILKVAQQSFEGKVEVRIAGEIDGGDTVH